MDIKKVFTKKYEVNAWLGSESRSGPGSSVQRNLKLLENLRLFVSSNDIKTIADVCCGDFNWMRHFDFNLIKRYRGYDIVDSLVAKNNELYKTEKILFEQKDIVNSYLGRFDLVLCKDCLVHMSYSDALRAIEHIWESGSTFFVSTSFVGADNKDIKTGNWRQIDLTQHPFCLSQPVCVWENLEGLTGNNSNKTISIWEIQ